MHLVLIRHLWGVERPWETAFPRFKAEGFAGIEAPLPAPADVPRFSDLLQLHGFCYVPQIFTAGADVEEHLASFRDQVGKAAALQPRFINAHSGSDAWSAAEAKRFYREALAIERDSGARVAHETHRGRVFFSPWATREVLDVCPGLALTCDYSHWVCVAERLIDSEAAILRQCAEQCLHLHARVGYEEGPQVPDPRAAEYQRHVEAHERWWDLIWTAQRRRGLEATTLTPEFGPPAYLHTLPHTGMPVADLWEICTWQGQRQARRFADGGWGATPGSPAQRATSGV